MAHFDLVVVGGGHAGVEAALASARLGLQTLLLTFQQNAIARMSCNPAIGGVAKGQLVREIDALGGAMGRIADRAGIQFRMLNTSKGPAVWGPRAQQDMYLYEKLMQKHLAEVKNLTIMEDELLRFEKNGALFSLQLKNSSLSSSALIITSGTFLKGMMYRGEDRMEGGRVGEPAATSLSQSLADHNIVLRRLKTGTPMRIQGDSIDYEQMGVQHGDKQPLPFSIWSDHELNNRARCWTTRTNDLTHRIIRSAFPRSPLFDGSIQAFGPRYCPGIEDKISRFSERNSHQLFVEPEDSLGERIYLNGFNSSLPQEVQEEAMRTIPGLQNATVLLYGYDIEYDAIRATQLHPTLEHKKIPNLYFAGQVNGTSGYEEAAVQGLVAGANAALKLLEKEPLLLRRDEAYAGVLLDDLTTIALDEPYRMFTSRAEYRLLLRQDNTESRLLEKGAHLGLVSDEQQELYRQSRQRVREAKESLSIRVVKPEEINRQLEQLGESAISTPATALELLRRGEAPLDALFEFSSLNDRLKQQEKIEIWADELYSSYYKRLEKELTFLANYQNILIPKELDYQKIPNLSSEGREALMRERPLNLLGAKKIAGVRPTDLSTLYRFLAKIDS